MTTPNMKHKSEVVIMETNEISSETVQFPAGTTIIQKGVENRKLYVLLEEKCSVYKHGSEIASFHEGGTLFREMSMILNVSRTAIVKLQLRLRFMF